MGIRISTVRLADNIYMLSDSGGMGNSKVLPASETALPLLTYKNEIIFYMDGEVVKVFHPESGHTDGDSVIYFKNANVIHMGDLYFEGFYPYYKPWLSITSSCTFQDLPIIKLILSPNSCNIISCGN